MRGSFSAEMYRTLCAEELVRATDKLINTEMTEVNQLPIFFSLNSNQSQILLTSKATLDTWIHKNI